MIFPSSWKSHLRKPLSVRERLLLITVGTCAVALIVSAVLEIILDSSRARILLMERLNITVEMVMRQSQAPLDFLDSKAANENLLALAPEQNITQVCLYERTGLRFASYLAESQKHLTTFEKECPNPEIPQEKFGWSNVEIFRNIYRDTEKIGSIYIKRNLVDLHDDLFAQIIYKIGIVLLVIIMVPFFSSYLRRRFSDPISRLARASRDFSRNRQITLEVEKQNDDELGELADSMNLMMKEIRVHEAKLHHAIQELTQSNIALERFAHICSHDLQEPLRMISNYSSLLEKSCEGRLDEEAETYLHFITDGAKRMRELIIDVLSYARLGHSDKTMQQVDMNALAKEVVQALHTLITERNATVSIDPLPEIICNKVLIYQTLQNLIGNAMKFCHTTPEVHVGAKRFKNGWVFSVADNGIGIDPKYQGKIFEIFSSLHRRDEFEGTGIGLAICKKAVEHHSGSIWMESEPGEGTTFFFHLPDDRID